jgi:hypothetical protein
MRIRPHYYVSLIFLKRDERQESKGMREDTQRMENLILRKGDMSTQCQNTVHIWALCRLFLFWDIHVPTFFRA